MYKDSLWVALSKNGVSATFGATKLTIDNCLRKDIVVMDMLSEALREFL